MWIEETGLDPMARGPKWKKQPTQQQLDGFAPGVIGCGLSGLNGHHEKGECGV